MKLKRDQLEIIQILTYFIHQRPKHQSKERSVPVTFEGNTPGYIWKQKLALEGDSWQGNTLKRVSHDCQKSDRLDISHRRVLIAAKKSLIGTEMTIENNKEMAASTISVSKQQKIIIVALYQLLNMGRELPIRYAIETKRNQPTAS